MCSRTCAELGKIYPCSFQLPIFFLPNALSQAADNMATLLLSSLVPAGSLCTVLRAAACSWSYSSVRACNNTSARLTCGAVTDRPVAPKLHRQSGAIPRSMLSLIGRLPSKDDLKALASKLDSVSGQVNDVNQYMKIVSEASAQKGKREQIKQTTDVDGYEVESLVDISALLLPTAREAVLKEAAAHGATLIHTGHSTSAAGKFCPAETGEQCNKER